MRRRWLAIFVFLSFAALAHAAPTPDSAAGMLDFAASLSRSGDSFRAATEYIRVLHHYGEEEGPRRAALSGLAKAYAQAGRWNDAAETLAKLNAEAPTPETRAMLGDALMRAGRNGDAAALFLTAPQSQDERTMGTLAWLKTNSPDPAPETADAYVVARYRALPQKSATAAGVMSAVLPGSGHLYVDRPHDALLAFVLNGAFIWGTWEAARREEWALTGILGACELFWYSGTIVGAVNGAEKWNRREEERFFDEDGKGARPSWSAAPLVAPDLGGFSLSVRW